MKIKNIVTVSLIVFVVLIIGVLGAAAFFNNNNSNNLETGISKMQVAAHSAPSDCWVIVSDKVYNLTDFLSLHPAGPERITPFCGQDGTQAFTTRGGDNPHPAQANDTLQAYYVGDLSR